MTWQFQLETPVADVVKTVHKSKLVNFFFYEAAKVLRFLSDKAGLDKAVEPNEMPTIAQNFKQIADTLTPILR